MKKLLSTLLIGVILFAPMTEAQSPARKLLRGTANLLTGWVEIPKNIYDTTVEANVLSGITFGAVEGIGMAIVRTGAGVYDIVTFPLPLPENYEPVLFPEFVFETSEVVIVEVAEVKTLEIVNE